MRPGRRPWQFDLVMRRSTVRFRQAARYRSPGQRPGLRRFPRSMRQRPWCSPAGRGPAADSAGRRRCRGDRLHRRRIVDRPGCHPGRRTTSSSPRRVLTTHPTPVSCHADASGMCCRPPKALRRASTIRSLTRTLSRSARGGVAGLPAQQQPEPMPPAGIFDRDGLEAERLLNDRDTMGPAWYAAQRQPDRRRRSVRLLRCGGCRASRHRRSRRLAGSPSPGRYRPTGRSMRRCFRSPARSARSDFGQMQPVVQPSRPTAAEWSNPECR
jgi:hypothetical protein